MDYFISILVGTFILEDLALASGLVLVLEQKITLEMAMLACFIGICVGDVFIYLCGYAASYFQLDNRFKILKRIRYRMAELERGQWLSFSIVLSRAIPGTRVPTYLAAGFARYSFLGFLILTILSVAAWVGVAFALGHSVQKFLMANWFLSLLVAIGILQFVRFFAVNLSTHWTSKALLHSWRKWMSFEFWPGWLFYLPIGPIYLFLAIKYRSFFAPFYASPFLKHGGLVGESKWDFLKHLNPSTKSTLKACYLESNLDFTQVKARLDEFGIQFPFVLKPDIGQRGFGVRIIRNDFELTEYLLVSGLDTIAQELSHFHREAGVFYVRLPNESKGFIFSITDKEFPDVIGDGKRPLGDLILSDPRARIIAPVYFERHAKQLDRVLNPAEKFQLIECGNHCQGAIFKNGNELATQELLDSIENAVQSIPHFTFGRVDIRYENKEGLRRGQFEIIEVNGAGSEATHIWDERTTLSEAYSVLFRQWDYLFKIGKFNRSTGISKDRARIGSFLLECLRVYRRKEVLSVSS